MTIQISPGILQGAVTAPSSKSFSIRALVADYLAGGGSVLHNLSDCEDVLAAQKALVELPLGMPVECGESALALHLIAPVAALRSRPVLFGAQGTLRQRPLASLVHALEVFGAQCNHSESGSLLRVEGPLRSGKNRLDGRFGSQAVSGLLMALPLLDGDSEITLLHPVSLPYIDLTLHVMHLFGVHIEAMPNPQSAEIRYLIPGGQSYRPTELTVTGDWSGAAALMVAAAVSSAIYQRSECVVRGVGAVDFAAPDSTIVEVLRAAGVLCMPLADGWKISVSDDLKPFVFDLTHAPDLAPALTALAAHIPGISRLTGAGRLMSKESSRGEVLQQIFEQMGVQIDLWADELVIYGGNRRDTSALELVVDCRNDHRIAMAVAIATVGAQTPVTLSGASCIAKTYPRFWDDLALLGLRIQKIA